MDEATTTRATLAENSAPSMEWDYKTLGKVIELLSFTLKKGSPIGYCSAPHPTILNGSSGSVHLWRLPIDLAGEVRSGGEAEARRLWIKRKWRDYICCANSEMNTLPGRLSMVSVHPRTSPGWKNQFDWRLSSSYRYPALLLTSGAILVVLLKPVSVDASLMAKAILVANPIAWRWMVSPVVTTTYFKLKPAAAGREFGCDLSGQKG